MADKETELYQNMRFYGEMRFKQLTVFLAWLAIAGTGVASDSGCENILDGASLQLIIGFASMLVTGIIWIMEISSTKHFFAHRDNQDETIKWPVANIQLRHLNATNATVLFYALSYFFWFYFTYTLKGNYVLLIIYGIVFLILLIHTVLNYKTLWNFKEENNITKEDETDKK